MITTIEVKKRQKKIAPAILWDLKYDPETQKVYVNSDTFDRLNLDEKGFSLAKDDDDPFSIYVKIHSDSPQFYESKGAKKNFSFKSEKFGNHIKNIGLEVVLVHAVEDFYQVRLVERSATTQEVIADYEERVVNLADNAEINETVSNSQEVEGAIEF